MGSTESKMAVSAPVKAEPSIKHDRVGELLDPRSPSTTFDRTPIQVSSWTPVRSRPPLIIHQGLVLRLLVPFGNRQIPSLGPMYLAVGLQGCTLQL